MVATIHGAEGDRTPDLSVANAALSQLSYGPECTRRRTFTAGFGHEVSAKSDQLDGRDRIRTCDLYDVNVAL